MKQSRSARGDPPRRALDPSVADGGTATEPAPPVTWSVARTTGGLRLRIRPLEPSDREALAEGYQQLSETSRRQRFVVPPSHLSSDALTYLTSVDHVNHEAIGAFVLKQRRYQGMAVARYIRTAGDPTVAEVAVTVLDRYQRRGVGSLLMRTLAELAIANGIRRFCAFILADNELALELAGEASASITRVEPGVVRVDVDLPTDDATMARAVRMAARLGVRAPVIAAPTTPPRR
jgi:L-amino acid N-acyltransferase YncA